MEDGRIAVGDVEIIALRDATIAYPLEQMFPDVTEEAFAPYRERYPDAFARATWVIPVRAFVVRSGGWTVLVDTGLGTVHEITSRMGGTGRIVEALGHVEVDPDDIDVVVLTHLHLDHTGGTIREEDDAFRPVFRRARHLLHRADLDLVRRIAPQAPLFDATVLTLERLGLLEPVVDGHRVNDRVRLLHTPGHTPGSLSALVASGTDRAILTGDALPHPVHLSEPSWRYTSDGDHQTAVGTRRALIDRIEAERLIFVPTHFPEPFGGIVRVEGRCYWQGRH